MPDRARLPRERVRLTVNGAVQGVGFRPFVYREAHRIGIGGFVANTTAGVTIEAEGPPEAVAAFVGLVRSGPPAPAAVAMIEAIGLPPAGDSAFEIRQSALIGERTATVLPDLATCEACLAELFDPANRRYRYPFINCTACGPRYSIVTELPYDRTRTTMRGFTLCAACRAEYDQPADRRFHAEPNACPECGPQLALWDAAGEALADGQAALAGAVQALRSGAIVAVKGTGGFHLMVDARDEAAVGRLRRRKLREEKPFAVLFPSLAAIEAECALSEPERSLLLSAGRPITLVRRRGQGLAEAVAPRNPRIGAMLPHAPLQHLLLAELGFPLVATSGNRSSEPIVIDEREAPRRLAGIADLFLVHDRPIVRPLDDSVTQVVAGRPQMLRRARGFAPLTVGGKASAGVLGLGGHLKSTVAISTGSGVVLGQHIGDLDHAEARDAYDRARRDLMRLCDTPPRLAVRDLHPDYHSSRVAEASGVPVVTVQHHLAHVAAGMAEHGLRPPVLGVAWDGTGYGPDGTVWGGEFLHVTEAGWRRVAHLRPFRLPGGEAAVSEPRRSAFGILHAAFGRRAAAMAHLAPIAEFAESDRQILATMCERGVNAPLSTSAGRLFDAFAALAGLCQRSTYEGQAAAMLEWAASDDAGGRAAPYPVRLRSDASGLLVLDWEPLLDGFLTDLAAGSRVAAMSRALHLGLAAAIGAVAARMGVNQVVLTGGCFQNTRLTEAAIDALRTAGLTPYWHEAVPPNDGGLAVGQVMWATSRMSAGETPPCA